MADRASSSAALRRAWNQRAAGGGHTPAARRSRLGLYTVVLLVLVGLLVWWLWQPGQRVYVALLAEKYGPSLAVVEKKEVELLLPPTIDPASIFEGDLAPLENAIAGKQFVLRNLGRQGMAKRVAGELPESLAGAVDRAWDVRKAELLVLYVHAYGISIEGVPYLLWNEDLASELRRAQGKPSLFPLADLLKSVGDIGARRTLLVLDCGELAFEPRLGMFVNEFPRLLEQEIAAKRYPHSLWVVTGHSPLETAHVWADNRRSVFGQYVMEALSKPGDNENDLTASAFFRRVYDGVQRAVQRGGGAVQRPMFLIGGKGRVAVEDVPSDEILKWQFFVPQEAVAAAGRSLPLGEGRGEQRQRAPTIGLTTPLIAQAEKPGDSKPAEPPPVGDEKSEKPKTPDVKKQPADVPAASPTDAAAAAPDKPDAKSATADPFIEIWQLCRDLENPDNRAIRWSPVDYAPHLWSRFRRQLIWHQLRGEIEGGLVSNATNRQFIERSIRDPLRELFKAGAVPNVSSSYALPLLSRIFQARRQFFEDAAQRQPGGYVTADAPDERVANFARARRVANAIQFSAGECVRLYGFTLHFREAERYGLLSGALTEAANLREKLESWEGKPLDDPGLAWTENRDRCDEFLQSYSDLRLRLRDELRGLVDARLRYGTIVREPDQPFQRRPTPSLEDDAGRAHWVDLSLRLGQTGSTSQSGEVPGAFLLELSPAAASGLEKHLATLAKVAGGGRSDADLWTMYRQLGSAIRQAAMALPRQIADASATTTDPAARLAEMRLRLLDPADAEDDALTAIRSPLLARTWLPQPGPELKITAGPAINLGPGEQREVKLVYEWSGDEGAEATIDLKHIDAEQGASVVSIVPGRPPETVSRSGTLTGFVVKAPRPLPTGAAARLSTEVVYTVQIGARKFTSPPVAVRLFDDEFVDLLIEQVTDENKPELDPPLRRDEQDRAAPIRLADRIALVRHRLSPYPRGTAVYRFSIDSRGKVKERQVAVDVLRVVQSTGALKSADFDERGQPKPGTLQDLDAVPHTMTLSLGSPQPYRFDEDPAKKAAEKDKAAEKPKADGKNGGAEGDPPVAEGKTAAKTPADPKPPAIDFRDGLVFRIEEKSPPEGGAPRVWYHAVEFQPLHPRRYVTSLVTYNAARRTLEIAVRPKIDDLPYPPDGFDVEWEFAETNAQITGWRGPARGRGTRDRPLEPLKIENFVPKMDKDQDTLEVFVAVDGYPRAFAHEVLLSAGAVATPASTTFRRVKVVSPANAQVFKGDPDSTDPFPILVEARFDAVSEEGDRIGVTFDDDQATSVTLPSTRARHALFTPGKLGAASFEIRVGDYVRDVRRKTDGDALSFTTASQDKPIAITAEISAATKVYHDSPRARYVLVDYRDPTVIAVPPKPDLIVHKKPMTVNLAAIAADEGGIERVEYYRVGQNKRRLDEADLAKPNLLEIWRMDRPQLDEKFARPVSYNTEKLDSGTYWVWAVAFDRVGRRSLETRLGLFRIEAPESEGKKIAGVTVKGQAKYVDGVSRDGITITLSTADGKNVDSTQPAGVANPAAPPAVAGQPAPRPEFWFEFKDVPPGKYVLTAKGTELTPAGRVGGPKKFRHSDPLSFEVKPGDKGTITLNPLKLTTDR